MCYTHKGQKDFQAETTWILLPGSLHRRIVELSHQHPLNGYRGIMATYRMIVKHYVWKGLFTDVLQHCKKCSSCQSRRAPRGQYPTLSRPMSDQPFQTVVSEFSGKMGPATGNQRYRYFVVFADQVTKWPIVVPVKAPTADELIRALETAVYHIMDIWTL